MEKLIAACGLVCSECEAFLATQANDAEEIARIAAESSRQYGHEIKPEHIWCDGCMTESERKCGHAADCGIRSCVRAKGIANCAFCEDFPCDEIAGFMETQPEARQTLEAIRQGTA